MDQTPPCKHFNILRINLLLDRFRELLSRFWLSVCLVFRASFLCPDFPGFFLLPLGRQPENWPFTGLLPCQRLCESASSTASDARLLLHSVAHSSLELTVDGSNSST